MYFGVSLGSVLLGGNMYLNFFLTSLVEIPGNAFAIYAMNRLANLTNSILKALNCRGLLQQKKSTNQAREKGCDRDMIG